MKIKIIWTPTHTVGGMQPRNYSNHVEADVVPRVGEEVTFTDCDDGGERSGVVQSVQHHLCDDKCILSVIIK